jgi:hypothetical protein
MHISSNIACARSKNPPNQSSMGRRKSLHANLSNLHTGNKNEAGTEQISTRKNEKLWRVAPNRTAAKTRRQKQTGRGNEEAERHLSGNWRSLAGALGWHGDEIRQREKSLRDTCLSTKDRTARAGDDTETNGWET